MNFDDFKPLSVSRMGGQVDYQGSTKVLNGCAVLARNVRYTPDTAGTRYGTLTTMAVQRDDNQNGDITGLDVLEVIGRVNAGYRAIVFDSIGDLYIENPDGSGVLVPLTPPFVTGSGGVATITSVTWNGTGHETFAIAVVNSTAGFAIGSSIFVTGCSNPFFNGSWSGGSAIRSIGSNTITWIIPTDGSHGFHTGTGGSIVNTSALTSGSLPAGARMRTSTGDNNMLMAFEDGQDSVAPPIMYRGQTAQVMPISQNPIGAVWQAGRWYQVGDLVRATDGKWWRCTASATAESGPNAPQWPSSYGYFSSAGGAWVPAITVDIVGLSQWEEWTPACVQYLPGPNVVGTGVVRSQNTGSLPAGKDVYIKVDYRTNASQQATPRSAAMVYRGTQAKDKLTFGTVVNSAIVGGLPMPRWTAEMFMNPTDSVFTRMNMGVYIAVVASGSAPPLDSAYFFSGITAPTNPITVALVQSLANNISIGCPVPNGPIIVDRNIAGNNGISTTFVGRGGSRYMIVLRKDANGSLCPVDPDSPLLVNLVGEISVAIVEIARDANGLVTATVGDTTGFAVGQKITVQGVTGDGSFNGTFTITNVQQTLDPQGILQWSDSANLSASNDQTGAVVLPAGPLPTAFLPPGGAFDIQDIAAFTVASLGDGAPDNQKAGPYFYVSASSPSNPFTTQILSMQGPLTIDRTIVSLQRFAGGTVNCVLTDVTGITPGMTAIVQSQGDASFNGNFQIESIIPGTGDGGTLVWQQPDSAAIAGPTGGGLPLIIQQGTLGEVQAVVQDASGLAVGEDIQISGAPIAAFNGFFTIAKILGNVVTFPAAATGQALKFTGTQVQFLGGVTATFYPHTSSFSGQCELRNAVDGGNNPGSPQYPAQATAGGSSLMFNPVQFNGSVDPNVQPIEWAALDDNGNITGYSTPWSGARQNYTMIVTAVLVFPQAGHYTIHIEHDDGMYWGMGNGASRVSGPQNCPNPSATLTAANGYPVMGANNVSALNEDSYVVNIPAAGFYPIEIDYAQSTGPQCLVVTVNGGNVFGQYTAGPSVGITGTMTLLQNLPTCAPAGTINITSIQQDAAGNVSVVVDDLGGLTAGQTVRIKSVDRATYFSGNGWVELISANLNPDGLSGTIAFINPWFGTPPNAAFALSNPVGWTVEGKPDILINFEDSALDSDVDVTGQLASTGIYDASDLYFVPSLRMTAYVDNKKYPASFVFSNQDDPGNIVTSSGDPNVQGSGIFVCQGADSSRAVCVREIKDGPIFALKEKGGWQINPSDNLPSQWNSNQRWNDYGPACADLVAVGHNFIAFWDITKGPHVYVNGQLEWIGKELSNSGTLKRVNTTALSQGWAAVDEEALELKFGIPLDGASLPNYELVVNFEGGWGFPEIVNRFGKLIVPREARKWSINPWSARCAKSVRRSLNTQQGGLVPTPPSDPRILDRQFLYGMPGSPVAASDQPMQLFKTVRQNNVVTFYWQV
jgi:hypothetical protein